MNDWIDVPWGKYVQRDLEDQIREEQAVRKVNNTTNTQTMATITTSGVLADLKNGYTRLKKDDKGFGSIEEKYGLTVDEVKELFQTPSLKAKKTATPRRKLEIIDDLSTPQGADTIALTVTGVGGEGFPATLTSWPEVSAVLPDVDQKNAPQTSPEIIEEDKTANSVNKDSLFA